MSAAAAARPKQNRRIPLPPCLSEQITLPEKDHARIPNPFFAALRLKFWTAFEKDIALILIERCYGGSPDGSGGWNRPKWVQLPAKEIARELGNLGESGEEKVEGIEKCLNALEDRGLIESLLAGRVKYYRLCPEKFDLAPDRHARTIERKPPETAEESHIVEVKPTEPLVIMPGDKSRPFVVGDYRGSVSGCGYSRPIKFLPFIDEAGAFGFSFPELPMREFDLEIHSREGENEAKNDRRRGVHTSARAIENNGHSKDESRQKAAAEEIERAELGLMTDFLNRWFGKELGDVPGAIAKKATEALGGGTHDEFARLINKRASKVEFLSWKMVLIWAADVGREAARRNPPARKLTPEQEADMAELAERQRKRFHQ